MMDKFKSKNYFKFCDILNVDVDRCASSSQINFHGIRRLYRKNLRAVSQPVRVNSLQICSRRDMHNKAKELNIFKSKSCVLKNVITSNGLEGNSLQLVRWYLD